MSTPFEQTPDEIREDAERDKRLKELDHRIRQEKREDKVAQHHASDNTKNASAMAQGFRLSAEFVSGIAAGTLLGWIIDQLVNTTPWGFIIGLLLGFCAGMMNLMRTAGVFKKTK
jgi:ATP synthase protein I